MVLLEELDLKGFLLLQVGILEYMAVVQLLELLFVGVKDLAGQPLGLLRLVHCFEVGLGCYNIFIIAV